MKRYVTALRLTLTESVLFVEAGSHMADVASLGVSLFRFAQFREKGIQRVLQL